MKVFFALALSLLLAMGGAANPITWTLAPLQFTSTSASGGLAVTGTVTGYFTYDADTNMYSNWNIVFSGFAPYETLTLTPETSFIPTFTSPPYSLGCPGATPSSARGSSPDACSVFFYSNQPGANPGQPQIDLGLGFTPQLTNAGGTVSVSSSFDSSPLVLDVPSYASFALESSGSASATAVTNYTISGQVTSASGTAVSGVTMTLSGSQSSSTLTNTAGSYSFTVAPGGNYTVTPSLNGYAFTPPSQTFDNLSGSETANFKATAAPSINAGGIVNAASYKPPVAPGSIASAFGDFLLGAPMSDTALPLSTSLEGLSVQWGSSCVSSTACPELAFGGDEPLFFVSGGQVNLQVSWGTPVTAEGAEQWPDTLDAVLNGQAGAGQTVVVTAFAPGIFTTNSEGTGQGAILDLSGHLVDSFNPVTAGDYVEIFCTGLGTVTNQPEDGVPGPGAPFAWTKTMPTVSIGGAAVTNVEYSGLAPGYVGLYQVNAQVPAGAATGSAVPVVISIGGVASNTVTMAVQ